MTQKFNLVYDLHMLAQDDLELGMSQPTTLLVAMLEEDPHLGRQPTRVQVGIFDVGPVIPRRGDRIYTQINMSLLVFKDQDRDDWWKFFPLERRNAAAMNGGLAVYVQRSGGPNTALLVATASGTTAGIVPDWGVGWCVQELKRNLLQLESY
jgi:hypothetical protein